MKIVSRSCMEVDSARPFTADTGITYSEDGKCGASKWDFTMKVPEEQVVLDKIQTLLLNLGSDELTLNQINALREQATRLVDGKAFQGLIKHTYR